MKKIISLALVLCLIFSLTVLADEGSDVKEVLSLIKGRLPDTDGFLNFESSKRQSGNIETYTFMWYSNEEPRREMSVRTTKSGIIISPKRKCGDANSMEFILFPPFLGFCLLQNRTSWLLLLQLFSFPVLGGKRSFLQ